MSKQNSTCKTQQQQQQQWKVMFSIVCNQTKKKYSILYVTLPPPPLDHHSSCQLYHCQIQIFSSKMKPQMYSQYFFLLSFQWKNSLRSLLRRISPFCFQCASVYTLIICMLCVGMQLLSDWRYVIATYVCERMCREVTRRRRLSIDPSVLRCTRRSVCHFANTFPPFVAWTIQKVWK